MEYIFSKLKTPKQQKIYRTWVTYFSPSHIQDPIYLQFVLCILSSIMSRYADEACQFSNITPFAFTPAEYKESFVKIFFKFCDKYEPEYKQFDKQQKTDPETVGGFKIENYVGTRKERFKLL